MYYNCLFIVVLTYAKVSKNNKLSLRQKDIPRPRCVETHLLDDKANKDRETKSFEGLLFDLQYEGLKVDRLLEDTNKLNISYETLKKRLLAAVHEEIHDLREMNSNLSRQNDDLRRELVKTDAELTDAYNRLNRTVFGIGSRELAGKAEEKILNYVFPGCKKKPYYLRSFKNLLSFLSDPSSAVHSGPLAPDAWRKIPTKVQEGILKRKLWIVNNFNHINDHINSLKDLGNEIAHFPINYEDLISYYDKTSLEMAEATADCQRIINFDLPVI